MDKESKIYDRTEEAQIEGFATKRTVYLKKCPSGAEYGLRKLKFGEKLAIQKKLFSRAEVNPKDKEDIKIKANALLEAQAEMLYASLVKAPWKELVGAMTNDEIDENIEGTDMDTLLNMANNLNTVGGDTQEKSNGQSEAKETQ